MMVQAAEVERPEVTARAAQLEAAEAAQLEAGQLAAVAALAIRTWISGVAAATNRTARVSESVETQAAAVAFGTLAAVAVAELDSCEPTAAAPCIA